MAFKTTGSSSFKRMQLLIGMNVLPGIELFSQGAAPPNIVAAAAFHSRVRDGSEWFHCAMDTRIVFILRLNPENYIGKTNTQPYG